MEYEDITVARVERWIEITIDRPEKLNALRDRTSQEIMHAMDAGELNREILAVILKGSEKAFCTGIDTSEFEIEANEYFDYFRLRKRQRSINRMFRGVAEYTKPVITVVEGYALGGGLELALVGDIIVAGEGAQFGLPEVKLGMMPGGGGTQTLSRLIGKALAKELVWTGRRFSATEAKEYRMLNHVTPRGGALEKAREIARTVCENAPISVMLSKSVIDRGSGMSLADGTATEGDVSFMLYFTSDRAEGLSAFREKRTPVFRGE